MDEYCDFLENMALEEMDSKLLGRRPPEDNTMSCPYINEQAATLLV